jgi:hypothetical protein
MHRKETKTFARLIVCSVIPQRSHILEFGPDSYRGEFLYS